RSYHLEVVQQPSVAAEFGAAVLSRLPLAPPPVAQLIVRDGRGHIVEDDPDLGFFIAHLALYSADGRQELDAAPSAPGRPFPPNRLLYGTIVSSPHFLRNLQNRPGVFFIFPDVSVRRAGCYSLRIRL
ncbi:velvet factor, partial [Vararia minispora EC-137]